MFLAKCPGITNPSLVVCCMCLQVQWMIFSLSPSQILLSLAHHIFWFWVQWIFEMNRNEIRLVIWNALSSILYIRCTFWNIIWWRNGIAELNATRTQAGICVKGMFHRTGKLIINIITAREPQETLFKHNGDLKDFITVRWKYWLKKHYWMKLEQW